MEGPSNNSAFSSQNWRQKTNKKTSTYGERAANKAGRAALVTILLTIAIV